MTEKYVKPDENRKKQLDFDLSLIGLVTVLILVLVLMVFGKQWNCS